jgi:hypothetical protein
MQLPAHLGNVFALGQHPIGLGQLPHYLFGGVSFPRRHRGQAFLPTTVGGKTHTQPGSTRRGQVKYDDTHIVSPLRRRENAHYVADVHGHRVIFMSCHRPPISGQSCHRVIAGLRHPDGIVAFGNETCGDASDAQIIACVLQPRTTSPKCVHKKSRSSLQRFAIMVVSDRRRPGGWIRSHARLANDYQLASERGVAVGSRPLFRAVRNQLLTVWRGTP